MSDEIIFTPIARVRLWADEPGDPVFAETSGDEDEYLTISMSEQSVVLSANEAARLRHVIETWLRRVPRVVRVRDAS